MDLQKVFNQLSQTLPQKPSFSLVQFLFLWLAICFLSQKQLTSNNIIRSMFQNSYQNGTYFDLLDAKLPADKLKPLIRTTNVTTNNKTFDKDLKTFVLEFLTPTSKLSLPRQQKKDLYLIQQYLVLQIFLYPGLPWGLELVLSDLTKTKRRVILSPSGTKTETKPFFIKTPLSGWKENSWNNLCIDLYSYISAFKGQTFRSLDAINISGHFKLRRIYTAAGEPLQGEGEGESQEVKQVNFLPKNFYLPQGVNYVTRVNRYDPDAETQSQQTHSQNGYQPTQPSTKNSSFLKSSKTKPGIRPSVGKETAKTEKIINIKQRQREIEKVQAQPGKKIKDFLSNTNAQLIGRKKKQQQKSQSQSSQVLLQGVPKTAKSTQKYSKKKNLIKTQQMPPKARSSLDKNPSHIPAKSSNNPRVAAEQKSKTKAKLNPWRTTSKGVAAYSDHSQLEISKHEQRSIDTPQTLSLFKQPPHLAETKGFHRNGNGNGNGECSDSEYVELSQKFSTLTDGKFFRNEVKLGQQKTKPEKSSQEQQQQIQENIEMQSNSMYSSAKRQERCPQPNPIHQSICDSLQPYQPPKDTYDSALGRSSLYGFGQKLMRNFMDEVDRPYSPPLGQREATEQEVSECRREEKEEVELVYDPVLNCYYDHKTHTYYELKN